MNHLFQYEWQQKSLSSIALGARRPRNCGLFNRPRMKGSARDERSGAIHGRGVGRALLETSEKRKKNAEARDRASVLLWPSSVRASVRLPVGRSVGRSDRQSVNLTGRPADWLAGCLRFYVEVVQDLNTVGQTVWRSDEDAKTDACSSPSEAP